MRSETVFTQTDTGHERAEMSFLGKELGSVPVGVRIRRTMTVAGLLLGSGVIVWTFIELMRTPAPPPVSAKSEVRSRLSVASATPDLTRITPKRFSDRSASRLDELAPMDDEPVARVKNVQKPKVEMKPIRGGNLSIRGREPLEIEDFQLAVYETTVAQFTRCVDAGVCRAPSGRSEACNWGAEGRDDHPINCVSYLDAEAFCSWLDLRVPTEYEWQWAAQGRENTRNYPWGNSPEPQCDRVVMKGEDADCSVESTMPVGSRRRGASRDGIMDLAGNVWEWTSSDYSEGSALKSLRGGSWQHGRSAMFLTAKRAPLAPNAGTHDDGGFRCAR